MTDHTRAPRGLRRTTTLLVGAIGIVALAAVGAGTGGFGSAAPATGIPTATPSAPPSSPLSTGPTASPFPSGTPASIPSPSGSPIVTPLPGAAVRGPIDLLVVGDPERRFISEQTKTWCAPAGVQMVLASLGLADTSPAFQAELAGRIGEWEDRADSRNLGWGPTGMARALAAYGAAGYEVRVLATRADALRVAATAIERTGAPAILLAWRGAHTWVMTGFRGDADPGAYPDATVLGAYILDPWYPRISSIWGPSDPPGTYQDGAEMVRNFLPWKRPEGRYPDRDGRFVVVVPTVELSLPEGAVGSGG